MKNLVGLGAKRLGFGFVRQRSVSAPGFFFAAPGFYARPPLPKTYMQQPWSEDDPGFSS